jgi:hypothetical protein
MERIRVTVESTSSTVGPAMHAIPLWRKRPIVHLKENCLRSCNWCVLEALEQIGEGLREVFEWEGQYHCVFSDGHSGMMPVNDVKEELKKRGE